MAQSATTKSDIVERESERGVQMLIGAGVVLVASLLTLWTGTLVANSYRPMPNSTQYVLVRPFLYVTGVLGIIGSFVIAWFGFDRMNKAKKGPAVVVSCPSPPLAAQ